MKIFLILFVCIIYSSLSMGQNLDKRILIQKKDYPANTTYDDRNINISDSIKGNILNFGVLIGPHSSSIKKLAFSRGVFFEIYLKYSLSSEIHSIIAFSYWKAQVEEINAYYLKFPTETISSNAIKFGLDFSLFKIYKYLFSLGTSISIENISRTPSSVFSLETNIKLNLPIWNDNVDFLTAISYQSGMEAFNFGGGTNYSFFIYLVGLEINVTGILK